MGFLRYLCHMIGMQCFSSVFSSGVLKPLSSHSAAACYLVTKISICLYKILFFIIELCISCE